MAEMAPQLRRPVKGTVVEDVDGGIEHVRSFERGLRVIRGFGRQTPEMTLAEVARNAGLSRATARRLLHTLEHLGYAQRRDDRFSLTPKVMELGHAFLSSSGAQELAIPYMEQIRATLNESSSVAVLDGTEVVYIARVPANRVMTVHIGLGTRFPAYRTSLGRVLMTDCSEDELRDSWARTDRSKPAPKTITTFEQLKQVVNEVRSQGWSLVDQELEEDVAAVAAPIRNARGQVVAAMSISTHSSRVSREDIVSRFVPVLLEAAAGVSAAFASHSRHGLNQ